MFPQTNRKREFTGEEFVQIIFDEQTNPSAVAYLAEELNNASPNQQSHMRPDEAAGIPRDRYMLPVDYAGLTTQTRENLVSSDSKPYYHINSRVSAINKRVDWEIHLSRCVFTEEVNLTQLVSSKSLFISECVFLKGLTISEAQLTSLFISNLDGHRIKIDKSTIDILSLSGLTQPIAIEATSVKTLGMHTVIK